MQGPEVTAGHAAHSARAEGNRAAKYASGRSRSGRWQAIFGWKRASQSMLKRLHRVGLQIRRRCDAPKYAPILHAVCALRRYAASAMRSPRSPTRSAIHCATSARSQPTATSLSGTLVGNFFAAIIR